MIFYMILGAIITITLLIIIFVPLFGLLYLDIRFMNVINDDIREIKENFKK